MTEFLTETAVLIDGDVRPLADIVDDLDSVASFAVGQTRERVPHDCPPAPSRSSLGSVAVRRAAYSVTPEREPDWRERQFKD